MSFVYCLAGNVLVAETGRLLRQVAETLHTAVLVTNHVVGAGNFGRGPGAAVSHPAAQHINMEYKPALGEQWRGIPHVRLQLSRATAAADVACMTILSHPLRVSAVNRRLLMCSGTVTAIYMPAESTSPPFASTTALAATYYLHVL